MRKLEYQEIFATRPTLEDLKKEKRFPCYCIAENIRSLYNVGSIFRTSDAVRLKKLYLTGFTGFPPRREIEKTALGATESVPWKYNRNPADVASELKKENIKLIALEHTSGSIPFNEFKFITPFCLIIGNEVDGVSEELIKMSDNAIEIPMFGLKQSLNVSVAYGIIMYQALNQIFKDK